MKIPVNVDSPSLVMPEKDAVADEVPSSALKKVNSDPVGVHVCPGAGAAPHRVLPVAEVPAAMKLINIVVVKPKAAIVSHRNPD